MKYCLQQITRKKKGQKIHKTARKPTNQAKIPSTMSGFDDENESYSGSDGALKDLSDASKKSSHTTTKQNYKHVSFINVLPDLEDFEYQRLINNNRELTALNEVLHEPHTHSRPSLGTVPSFSSSSTKLNKYQSQTWATSSLSSLCSKPADFYKVVDEQEKLANENANMNAGRRSSTQTLNKFFNLREVEDVKFSSDNSLQHDPSVTGAKNMSKIGSIANGKNISEMSLEEIQILEDQLSRNRKVRKDASQDYSFQMIEDSSRGVWQNPSKTTTTGGGKLGSLSQKDLDMLEQKEKLLLQNGYPTRPWVRNNSCILNFKHSDKVERTVFVYVSGREHTWTSLEYYYKYIQRDNDHLVIGCWIPRKNVIQPEFEKSQFSEMIHFNKPIEYYKNMENKILGSCHNLLNYAIYKNNLQNCRPIQITCNLQTNDDAHNVFLDFVNEYQPHLNIITSVTYNHFIKFQNQTVKMAHFFTKFLNSCIVINQDYLDMPIHQNENRPIKQPTAQQTIDIIDDVIEKTAVFPYEDCSIQDMKHLHKYEPSTLNVAFRKYHFNFPSVPLKIDAQMKVTTPEGFFIRYGYMKPEIKHLHYPDYDHSKEDITVNRFYDYLNTRRDTPWIQSRYELAIAKFKPCLFYMDKTNESHSLAQACNSDFRRRGSEYDSNNAAMMMLKKVVSGGAAPMNNAGNTGGNSRRSSVNSADHEGTFRKLKSNESAAEQGQQNFENYYNQEFYLEKEKEQKKKLKEKQDKLKREMEREMTISSGNNLVKQKHDVMQKFKEERRQLQKMKREESSTLGPGSSHLKVVKSPDSEKDDSKSKKKSWKFW